MNVFVELFMAFCMGYFQAGLRGGINNFKWVLRGRCLHRPVDGLAVTGPVKIDGIRMPCFTWLDEDLWRTSLKRMTEFEVRPDDVVVVSYPKCGHHFLHEVLTMLMTGELKLNKEQKMSRFLEFFAYPQDHFDKIPSPRVILTHMPLKYLPKQVLEGKCKIIRCSRNPKDMMVSFHNHVLSLKYHFYNESFADYFRLHTEEPSDAQYGSYFDYERDLWEALKPLVDSRIVTNITFEDMKLNPVPTFKKIAEHLELSRNEEFFEKVAIETSFAKVKAAKSAEMAPFMRAGTSIWRRGVVGDWRRHFTPEMSVKVDEKMREKWGGTPLMEMFNFGEEIDDDQC